MSLVKKQTIHALVVTKGLKETREFLKWRNLGAAYSINLSNVRIKRT